MQCLVHIIYPQTNMHLRIQKQSMQMLLLFFISFLVGISGDSGTAIRISPQFVSIPPIVTYVNRSHFSSSEAAHLVCKVWPPNANVSILSVQRQRHMSLPNSASPLSLVPLSPVSFHQRLDIAPPPSNFSHSDLSSQSMSVSSARGLPNPFSSVVARVTVTEQSDFWRSNEAVDMHCKASTQFGTIISEPFRILQTRMNGFVGPDGRPQSESVEHMQFLQGNIAYVPCSLPTVSHPPPIVQFLFNGKAIVQGVKYKQIQRPNENRVLLLINLFKSTDEGRYQCSLTNPITGQTVMSPVIWNLSARITMEPESEKVLLPLHHNAADSTQRQIVVEEGDDVTMFCIISGAPTPRVRTHKHSAENNRYQSDSVFGFLHIPNVETADKGIYMCESLAGTVSNAELVVKPRLRMTQLPTNVRISSYGSSAEFRCNSSIPSVLPFWLFGGEFVPTQAAKVLRIDSVKESDLGIYQCVLRSQTADGQTDKWVSASATLSLQSDRLISQPIELKNVIPLSQRSDMLHDVFTAEMIPKVEMIFDNLAVYLKWQLSEDTLRSSRLHMSPGLGNRQLPHPNFRVEYAIQTSQPVLNPGLVGLIEPEPATWTSTKEIVAIGRENYKFITGDPLQPGKTYRFRVRAVNPETGQDMVAPSGWSSPVSTNHISSVQPPVITSCQLYQDNRLNVTWTYNGDGSDGGTGDGTIPIINDPHRPMPSPLSPQHQLQQPFEIFKPDFFLILARSKIRSVKSTPDHKGEAEVISYSRYQATQVNGTDAREGFVYNVNASFTYQVIVYGVKIENGFRRVTLFSAPKEVSLPSPLLSRFSFMDVLMKNKPIFIGLGSLAILVLLIILTLIITCIWRQRKDRRRRRRVKQNGFVCGYSETDKYNNQQQQPDGPGSDGQFLHRPPSPSGKGSGGVNSQQTGQSMMMGTLMRSNFSDSDAQKQTSGNPVVQQQQNQFAMNTLPNSPNRQTGSVMQLNSPVGGYYGGQGGFYHHHQSHSSLLLPPPQGAPPVFQSGTLPGVPNKYLRQQQAAYQMAAHQQKFGSQVGGMPGGEDQAILMRDYYQQQMYQQQQAAGQPPFMYAMNNPAAFMSPQQQNDSINRRQSHHSQQHYGGSMNSAASLRREPPSGGSIHDACGMDATLLARSQMSPGGIQQRVNATSPTGQMLPPPPGYYQQGSQQGLHMSYNGGPGPHPGGGYPLTPSQQMSIYQQHQQAAFMMQQMSQQQPISPAFYGGPMTPGGGEMLPDPSLMRHPSIGRNTDGESIYSYFSQQDICHPQSHAMLNPLPEENQMNMGYTESCSQTAGGMNGGGPLMGANVTGSPTPLGGHRHHRRRRRKQPAQQQMDPSQELTEEGFNQQAQEGHFGVGGYNEAESGMDSEQQQMHHRHQGSGGLQDEFDNSNGNHKEGSSNDIASNGIPPSAAGLEQEGTSSSHRGGIMNNSGTNNTSLDRHASYNGMRGGMSNMVPLPPPSQPPPPPPATQMGLPHPRALAAAVGYYRPPPPQDGMMMNGNFNSCGSGSMGSMGLSSSGGLLVNPPPRIRDYSEYGIPSGIHPAPTNGNDGNSPTKPAGMMMTSPPPPPQHQQQKPPSSVPAYNGSLQSPFNGRYREGQA